MMSWGMMLCEVARQALLATLLARAELPLLRSASQPAEAHANCFASALLEDPIDDAMCCVAACAQWGGWLWVPQLC